MVFMVRKLLGVAAVASLVGVLFYSYLSSRIQFYKGEAAREEAVGALYESRRDLNNLKGANLIESNLSYQYRSQQHTIAELTRRLNGDDLTVVEEVGLLSELKALERQKLRVGERLGEMRGLIENLSMSSD